jgi:hypothetical protein
MHVRLTFFVLYGHYGLQVYALQVHRLACRRNCDRITCYLTSEVTKLAIDGSHLPFDQARPTLPPAVTAVPGVYRA